MRVCACACVRLCVCEGVDVSTNVLLMHIIKKTYNESVIQSTCHSEQFYVLLAPCESPGHLRRGPRSHEMHCNPSRCGDVDRTRSQYAMT